MEDFGGKTSNALAMVVGVLIILCVAAVVVAGTIKLITIIFG